MAAQNIALFQALGAKMEYLSQRQRVISQNIANGDTPNYKPQDLSPVDFGATLKKLTGNPGGQVTLATTNPAHMPKPDAVENAKAEKQKTTYEVKPAGNAVVMEEQMINSNQTTMDYNLMTSLYQKNVRMLQTALGVQ